jgi:hypothetical protein
MPPSREISQEQQHQRQERSRSFLLFSSLDFDLVASATDKLHSSVGSLVGSLDLSRTDDMEFLTKSSSSFRWKNKKHWKSMAGSKRYQSAGNSSRYQTDEDQESYQRRNAIRDSLKDALDTPDVF